MCNFNINNISNDNINMINIIIMLIILILLTLLLLFFNINNINVNIKILHASTEFIYWKCFNPRVPTTHRYALVCFLIYGVDQCDSIDENYESIPLYVGVESMLSEYNN